MTENTAIKPFYGTCRIVHIMMRVPAQVKVSPAIQRSPVGLVLLHASHASSEQHTPSNQPVQAQNHLSSLRVARPGFPTRACAHARKSNTRACAKPPRASCHNLERAVNYNRSLHTATHTRIHINKQTLHNTHDSKNKMHFVPETINMRRGKLRRMARGHGAL